MAQGTGESFDEVVLPHLDAAYRLARWRMGNEHDAEEVVQEASLRALRYFRTFTGGNGRAWFLQIVRNTCWGWRGHGMPAATESFDEELHSHSRGSCDPESLLLRTVDITLIERGLGKLSERSRELLVLRELEGLSYRELADDIGVPIGTVMSGLSRARKAFRRALDRELEQSGSPRRTQPRKQQGNDLPERRADQRRADQRTGIGSKRLERLRFPQSSRQGHRLHEGVNDVEKSSLDAIGSREFCTGRCA